jgi:hypothetical protein
MKRIVPVLALVVVALVGVLRAQEAPAASAPSEADAAAAVSAPATSAEPPAPAQPDFRRAPQHANVEVDEDVKLALGGFDPVAYFPEGGGKPAAGLAKLAAVHGGLTYRFASEAHRRLFLADPWTYEPAYGGWCAYAMAEGEKVEVDPESFRVLDGRLFVFYDGLFADTRKSWLKDEARLLPLADAAWTKLSGENSRGDAARRKALEVMAVKPVEARGAASQ